MKHLFLLCGLMLGLFTACSNKTTGQVYVVASDKVLAVGSYEGMYNLVKQGDENAPWEIFYDNISGFDYEQGYEYKILVDVVSVENTPMDASNRAYKLIKVLSKEKKQSDLPDWAKAKLQK